MEKDNKELNRWLEGFRFGVSMFVLLGIIVPFIENETLVLKQVLVSFCISLLIGPFWGLIVPKIRAIDKKRELANAKKNPQLINEEEDTEIEWWKEGLGLGLILFVLAGIVVPLITFQGLVLRKVLIAIPLCIAFGLFHGGMMHLLRKWNNSF